MMANTCRAAAAAAGSGSGSFSCSCCSSSSSSSCCCCCCCSCGVLVLVLVVVVSAGSAEQWRCDSLGPEQSDWRHWLWSLKWCLEAALRLCPSLSKFPCAVPAVSQIGSGFSLNSEFHLSESVSWAVQSPLNAERVHDNVSGMSQA